MSILVHVYQPRFVASDLLIGGSAVIDLEADDSGVTLMHRDPAALRTLLVEALEALDAATAGVDVA